MDSSPDIWESQRVKNRSRVVLCVGKLVRGDMDMEKNERYIDTKLQKMDRKLSCKFLRTMFMP